VPPPGALAAPARGAASFFSSSLIFLLLSSYLNELKGFSTLGGGVGVERWGQASGCGNQYKASQLARATRERERERE